MSAYVIALGARRGGGLLSRHGLASLFGADSAVVGLLATESAPAAILIRPVPTAACGQVIALHREPGTNLINGVFADHIRATHLGCRRARSIALEIAEYDFKQYGFDGRRPAGWHRIRSHPVPSGWTRERWPKATNASWPSSNTAKAATLRHADALQPWLSDQL